MGFKIPAAIVPIQTPDTASTSLQTNINLSSFQLKPTNPSLLSNGPPGDVSGDQRDPVGHVAEGPVPAEHCRALLHPRAAGVALASLGSLPRPPSVSETSSQ